MSTLLLGTPPEPTPPIRSRRWLGEVGAVLLVLLLLAEVGQLFALPWRDGGPLAGTELARYLDDRDGGAWLLAVRDTEGSLVRWESGNLAAVPGFQALSGEWPSGPREALAAFVETDAGVDELEQARRLRDVRALESRTRRLEGATASDEVMYTVVTREGQHIVGLGDDASVSVFDPPALWLPSDLSLGRRWETQGHVNGDAVRYRLAREVIDAGPREAALGRFDDCLRLRTTFTLTTPQGDTSHDVTTTEWMCPEVGIVHYEEPASATGPATVTQLVGTHDFPAVARDLPPAAALADGGEARDGESATGDLDGWALQRVGRAGSAFLLTEATTAPVHLSTDPPVVLIGTHRGDLIAFDAAAADGSIVWRYRAGGAIYGEPAVDAATGRIFVGSTDKRVHALDARGLFLWSFRTGDNVAGRPVVTDDLVIVASEDRRIHALDEATGHLRWQAETSGPVASSPSLAGDVVVVGSDDGAVYGFDAATGERRWVVAAGDAVEADIATAGGTAYVGARSGDVIAIDTSSGTVSWQSQVGAAVRATPVVTGDSVWIVDDGGALTRFGRADGDLRWSIEGDFRGDPLPLDAGRPAATGADADRVVVAHGSGVRLLDLDGRERGGWDLAAATGATDASSHLEFGPVAGGGALWLIDNAAILRRLGPPSTTVAELLPPSWIQDVGSTFTSGSPLTVTPLPYGDDALVVDLSSRVHLVDPATGLIRHDLGRVDPARDVGGGGPALVDDTLLLPVGDTLVAAALPDLARRWEFTGLGASFHPPVVTGDTVLWLSGSHGQDELRTRLHALDLATGAVRWEQDVTDEVLTGAATVSDGVVYVGTSALDLVTGAERWHAPLPGLTTGAPAVSDDGTVYVSGVAPEDADNHVTALDARDGSIRWSVPAGQDVVGIVDRLHLNGDVVVVPTGGRVTVGRDAATGAERWRHEASSDQLGGVTVVDATVWLVSTTGAVTVLDATTGALSHTFAEVEFPLDGYSATQHPARVGHRVLFPLGYFLLAFDVPEQP